MPFGLTNVLAIYQALINDILAKQLDKTYIAYLDDILIYSRKESEHVGYIREVL
jgi:Reverse transcriptase (RNA-dependent DNA polymerase)